MQQYRDAGVGAVFGRSWTGSTLLLLPRANGLGTSTREDQEELARAIKGNACACERK